MSRLEELIGRLERGERVTQGDVDRLSLLVALDIVKQGDEYVRSTAQTQRETDEALAALFA